MPRVKYSVRKAVIDVGSNSVLLTVEEKVGQGWTPVVELSEVTSLGEDTKRTLLLSPGAIDRTTAAIVRFAGEARKRGASVAAYATMAARIAKNTGELIQRCAEHDVPLRILSANDEAEFGFLSVVTDPLFKHHQRISIIDPGGQSTELVTATKSDQSWRIDYRKSFPIGTLGLIEQFIQSESIQTADLFRAMKWIDETVGLCYLPDQAGTPVVLGASGTNLISIREKLGSWAPEKVHGSWLDYEEVSKAVTWLGGMSNAERAAVPGMEKGRERTIHLGALILERYLYALRVLGVFVSVRGWRHAILEQE